MFRTLLLSLLLVLGAAPGWAQAPEILPDLTVARVIAPEQVHRGERTTVTAVVQNQGAIPVGGYVVNLILAGKVVDSKRNVQRLEPRQSEEFRLTFTPMVDGVLQARVEVDPPGAIAERDEANNAAEVSLAVSPPRSYHVTVEELKMEPPPRQGSGTEVLVRMRNDGQLPLYRVPLKVLVDGKEVLSKTRHFGFEPGKSLTLSLQWVPRVAGPHAVSVAVEPPGTDPAQASLQLDILPRATYDLKVVSLEPVGILVPGQKGALRVVLANEGELPTFAGQVGLLVDGVRLPGAVRPLDALEPGDDTTVEIDWTPGQLGKVKLEAVVEGRGLGEEADLEDNRGQVEVEVVAAKAPRQR